MWRDLLIIGIALLKGVKGDYQCTIVISFFLFIILSSIISGIFELEALKVCK